MIDYSFSLEELEYFLLILVRMTSFIFAAPFFGMNNTPARVKIGLGFFISLLLYHTTVPHSALSYQTVWGYSAIVMKEVLTGLFIGFGAQICTTVVTFAGMVIDMNIGLSMVSLMDPATRQNTSISGMYLQYTTMLMLIVSGMHRFLLTAFADTYRLIPINGAVFQEDALVGSMIKFLSEYIIIGFRICLPVFAVIMILNAVLGILAKVAPQMNMFAVGIQLKILVGLMTLFFTVAMLPGAADFIFQEMKVMVTRFVEGMM
ncbi:MAG: flagellar biosynthetic protein FliR [Lachnospiraceae bacterium]|nr:flagellar biosynthetic protein FliR [Lachnospiraceae bacterium]